MNKSAIKNFAVWARKKLMDDVRTRLAFIGITEEAAQEPLPSSTEQIQYFDIGGTEPEALSGAEIRYRKRLVERLQKEAASSSYQTAYQKLVESTSFVWFNRLVALRFMEVNDYLSDGIRMLSSADAGKQDPDIVSTPFDSDLEFTDKEHDEIVQLKLNNETDKLFRMLLFKRCHQLHKALPGLFQDEGDVTEFLMRLSVVDADSVIYHLVHDIDEEDWKDQVQIIGWIYQFYNSELKDETFALLKKNVKVTKERIPAATQLFTPDWIVRYMVENSLGRFYVEKRKTEGVYADGRGEDEMSISEIEKDRIAKEEAIAKEMGWKYFLPEAEQTAEVNEELKKIRAEYSALKPEELTFIDPCMGSGHILVYAFDVLMQIYLASGYEERDAAQSILKHNLYGLDIDDRAYQLSYFALMMKAMAYDKRILSRDIHPHVYAIEESNEIDRSLLEHFGKHLEKDERKEAVRQIGEVLDVMKDAKEYGSAIQVEVYDWDLLRRFVEDAETGGQIAIATINLEETQEKLLRLLEIAEVLAGKYWVSCTNPPYMGSANMNTKINDYVKSNYPDSKNDLFAVFIERCIQFLTKHGLEALITQHAWMYLSGFITLREKMRSLYILNMIHLGPRAFDEISGEVVQTASFVTCNARLKKSCGLYARLVDGNSESEKEKLFISGEMRYRSTQEAFEIIPEEPYTYWFTENTYRPFTGEGKLLGAIATPCAGLATGNNEIFQRMWHEVVYSNIGFSVNDVNETLNRSEKWYPCNSSGDFRKWSTDDLMVVNWKDDGADIKTYRNAAGKLAARPQNTRFYFKEGLTWNKLSTSRLAVKYKKKGFIFDDTSRSAFPHNMDTLLYYIGLLCSKVTLSYLKAFDPTMSFTNGDIVRIPIIDDNDIKVVVNDMVAKCIDLSLDDWDSYEVSWDFARHPILVFFDDETIDEHATEYDSNGNQRWTYSSERASLLSEAYDNWKEECEERFTTLQKNEEELNRIFIDIYGLQEELTPEVADKDITVHRIYDSKDDVPESMKGSAYIRTKQDEIKSFISYAIGCMFGRYSLDEDGLIYAGGDWNAKRYKDFQPDEDNVLPVTDEAYFDDDLISRFVEFVSKCFDASTLEENLTFIAKALDARSTDARSTIRAYILNDFFKDHVKTYQKRPIYWLFDSGKQNGFKAFVYMHRWNADTISRVRALYLHKVQEKYENEIRAIDTMIASMSDNRMIAREEKRKEKLKKQIAEVKEYDEILDHLANEHTNIDLDDGVKVNYEKVQTDRNGKKFKMLAPIK